MSAIENAKEIEVLVCDLWKNARPYFSGRRLEIQSKQVARMKNILESISALESEPCEMTCKHYDGDTESYEEICTECSRFYGDKFEPILNKKEETK